MERKYEVAYMRHVSGSSWDDFESVEFENACNYKEAVHKAKTGCIKWDACDVICYCETQETWYCQIFRETYVSGVKLGRTEF